MRILIVEDETAISEPLKKALERRQFVVDTAEDGKTGYTKASLNNYDSIILDLNLPEMDGLEVTKKLRAEGKRTPILMLTARSMQNNKYAGFEAGTDDYLTKPFDFKELLYRLEVLVKKTVDIPETLISCGDVNLDLRGLKVTIHNNQIPLNAKEFGILEYLMRNKGRVISQEELLEHVWDEEIDAFTQTVRTNIKTLRKKVDPGKKLIKTFKGKGYVIE
jgi:DNA-binding response OmpR family regulator